MKKTFLASLIGCALIAAASGSPAGAYTRPSGVFRQIDAQAGEAPTLDPTGPGSKTAIYSSMSDSGRYVAFDTLAGLLPVDTNQASDVYLRDLKTRKLTLVSIGQHGLAAAPAVDYMCMGNTGQYGIGDTGAALSFDPAISGDGRFVAFVSNAPNLVPGDSNVASDIFLYDVRNQSTERISLTSNGEQLDLVEAPSLGDGGPLPPVPELACPSSWAPSLDRHGRLATFTSDAIELSKERHDGTDVYLRDLRKDTTEQISVPTVELDPLQRCPESVVLSTFCAVDASSNSALSADGRFVAFDSGAGDLIEGDTNRTYDVFVRNLETKKTERVSIDSAGEQIGGRPSQGLQPYWQHLHTHSTMNGDVAGGDSDTFSQVQHAISGDGRYVVFTSDAEHLVPNDGRSRDVFVRDRKADRTERISVTSFGADLGTLPTWFTPSISRDGRFVTFEAYNDGSAQERVPNSPTGIVRFVYDRRTGALQLLGRTDTKGFKTGCSDDPTRTGGDEGDISADGRFVTFSTCDPNLLSSPWKEGDDYSPRIVRQDRGEILDAGLGVGGPHNAEPEPDPGICVGPNVCIPPLGFTSFRDARRDATADLAAFGADLVGASVAYRPDYGDLFVTLELTDLPDQNAGSGSGSTILQGLRFDAGGRTYEVRATGRRGGTFALFDCSSKLVCAATDLRGGYGTTGVRIVFSLPLDAIHGALRLTNVEAFTGVGTIEAGAVETLDRLPIGSAS